MTTAKLAAGNSGGRPGNDPSASPRARPGTPPLDEVTALLETGDVDPRGDVVLVVTNTTVAVSDRASTLARLLADGTLDRHASHFLAHPAPRGWVWAVLVAVDNVRLVLHSRPAAALEAA